MLARSVATKAVALGMAVAAAVAARLYPIDLWLLAPLLLTYAALLAWRPALWLFVIPALLPALDLAPWTGWFFLEEIDLMLLVTAAVGYWRLGTAPVHARLTHFAMFALILLGIAYAIGTARGLGLGPGLGVAPVADLNAFNNYLSHFNSLRIAKGFFWVIVLLPLLLRSVGPDMTAIRSLVIPGMLTGLATVCIAAIWERVLFPGLLNFSADYRITAPFSAMHTGGAALDGYLALAMPCLAAWLSGQGTRLRTAMAMLLLILGAYVGLATFSRGVYLAYIASVGLFALLALLGTRRGGQFGWPRLGAVLGFFVLAAFMLDRVFASSGYRGLAAGIAVLGAAFIVGGIPARKRRRAASSRMRASILLPVAAAAVLSGVSMLLSMDAVAATPLAVFKGVYGCFVASVALFFTGVWLALFAPVGRNLAGRLTMRAGLWWMMVNAALVAQHWGGNAALPDIIFLLGLAGIFLMINRVPASPLWQVDGPSMRLAFFAAVLLAAAIPFSASVYMTGRFSTVRDDLDGRLDHWSEAIAMMTPDIVTRTFGMGLGRYPETYFWNNLAHEIPGTVNYVRTAGDHPANTFLQLGGPTYPRGYGEVIRMLQRVDVTPGTAYLFSVDVRHRAKQPALDVALCERQLLYPQNCIGLPVKLAGTADGKWHRHEARVVSGSLGAGAWPLRAPVQLQMSTYGEGTIVDVDNVSLINLQTGAELVRNGSFTLTNDAWFFSSDRHHLPFHVKNFALNIYFELGWLGVAAFCLMLGHALVRLTSASLEGERLAQIELAALAGFLLVGLFDSLLDVPRLSLLFFLMLMLSVLRPMTSGRRRRRHQKSPTAAGLPAGSAPQPLSESPASIGNPAS